MDKMNTDPRQEDADWLRDYQTRWADRTLTDAQPVMIKIKKWSKVVAYKFGNPQLADDLEQQCRMAMLALDYKRKAGLDTLIVTILTNLNRREWRKRRGEKQDEVSEMPNTGTQEVLDASLAGISSERWINKLLKERSDLKATVISTIIAAPDIIGRKRIAEIASARLGRKVTRHQVEVVLEQLRDSLT